MISVCCFLFSVQFNTSLEKQFQSIHLHKHGVAQGVNVAEGNIHAVGSTEGKFNRAIKMSSEQMQWASYLTISCAGKSIGIINKGHCLEYIFMHNNIN